MNIINIKATHGPNYWSVTKHQLIVMQLDLEELEYNPTNEIDGFYPRIKKVFPSLYEHYCSEGEPGGFFTRVKEGTWMGHVIEHIALELQVLADLEVGYGRTRGTGTKGHYDVVFEYVDEESGRLAAKKAVSIARKLIDGVPIDANQHVKEIREKNLQNKPGPSTSSLLQEAEARDIPFIKMEENSTYQLGYGCLQKEIAATITSSTSNRAVEIACDKEVCRNLCNEMSVPVAKGDVINSVEDLESLIEDIGFPLVAKPISGNHGRGVTTNIKTYEEAEKAFKAASDISENVIMERHIAGNDYRLLTIDHQFVAAAKRIPAHVIGNGESTIQQLINEVNKDPRRGEGHEKSLTKIQVGTSAKAILSRKGYTLDTVLQDGETLYLDHAANLSKGGTAEDITNKVHPSVIATAERISTIVGLDISGVDIMATTLEKPLNTTGGAVLEVNAAPGFRMHLSPSEGESRNVAAPVLDMLYPENKSRIPITAVTGTNGKTTTTRLISHIMKEDGRGVGCTTTDGIYIRDQLIMDGDCGGPKSAKTVLRDPTVDTAVLECARGGILRSGLGFDKCDVGVVTNVTSDHLGIDGINTLDQMARVKSVVPESIHEKGYAVLNADDDRVYDMRKDISCNVALFSMDADNPRIVNHRKAGGICAIYKDQHIFICDGNTTHIIEEVEDIPLSFEGRAEFMIENILAATVAAYIQNVAPADLRESLRNFVPSPEQTPGRMNIFNFEDYDVLIDYAHNPAGLIAIQKFLDTSSYNHKEGIVTGIGDRRKEDSREIGRLAAEIFDKVIIREDSDLRGKEPGEATEIIKQGIAKSDENPPIAEIADEKEALLFAMENALPGSLIVLCAENVNEVISFMNEQKDKQQNSTPATLKKNHDNKTVAGMHIP